MIGQEPRRLRWPYALLAIVAAGGGAFSAAGVVMAGMFTVSNREQLTHWRHVAYIYLGLLGLSVVLLVVSGVALWRCRGARGQDHSAAI